MKQYILLLGDFVVPSQGQDHWKLYKVFEVNGVHKQGRYEKVWLKTLQGIKFLPHKTDSQSASQLYGWSYQITYATHMNKIVIMYGC